MRRPKIIYTMYREDKGEIDVITGSRAELSSVLECSPNTLYWTLNNKAHYKGWINIKFKDEYDEIIGRFTIRGNAGSVFTGTYSELAVKLNKTPERLRVLKHNPLTPNGKLSRVMTDWGETFVKAGIKV